MIDPSATIVYQAAGQEEMFPIEIDLEQVRRQRETGMKGLGQVLKSFRDRSAEFPVYDRTSGTDAYLYTLGKLEMPQQNSRAGLSTPAIAEPAALLPIEPEIGGIPPIVGKTVSG